MCTPIAAAANWLGLGGDRFETHEQRSASADSAQIWAVVETMGGRNGFFSWPLAWAVRAELDKLAGGPGFTQHRAHPGRLTVGDTIDFLTVAAVEPGRYVRFATDRSSPGVGSLEVWITPGQQADTSGDRSSSILHLRARWLAHGVTGRLYWLCLKPFHVIIFPEMLARMAQLAEQGARVS